MSSKTGGGKLVAIASIAAVLLIGVFAVSQYFSYSNSGVDHEEGIEAQVSTNAAKYSQFTQAAIESMGVANAYKDALKEVIVGSIEGRYGEGGVKPVAQAVREAYPNIDPNLFNQVQRIIESGRRDFFNEQKLLIARVQGYRSDLRKPWSKFWYTQAGYPQIDLKAPQYNPILSAATQDTFRTGTDKGIQFGK